MIESGTALLTGANRGIGQDIAAGLGALGWTVGVGARDAGRLATAVQQLRAVVETNVIGVLRVTNAKLPPLRRTAFPRIVNVSSSVGILINAACPGFVAIDLDQHRGTRTTSRAPRRRSAW